MKAPMRSCCLVSLLLGLVLASVGFAQSAGDLPMAPSATSPSSQSSPPARPPAAIAPVAPARL